MLDQTALQIAENIRKSQGLDTQRLKILDEYMSNPLKLYEEALDGITNQITAQLFTNDKNLDFVKFA